MSRADEVIYAKPALWDASLYRRARHLALVTRLTVRCAIKGHEWRRERPTRCVHVTVCRICGRYIGSQVADSNPESPCRWFRPSMVRPFTEDELARIKAGRPLRDPP